ncbi:M23 family metallopeptidase [Lysinibacillus sp. NPDC097214]|uniref:M23 family metallopeptidase n=1 Tax=Lysinibacillus sp. NPDC097214 TaxID=3390584 RepID=UPI003D031407
MEKSRKQTTKISPEEFGEAFLNGKFSNVYHQSTVEFKNVITLDQFIEYGSDFNAMVKKYNLEMVTNLKEDIKQYVWLDNNRKKVISVSYDDNDTIYGINLAPFVTYPESDRRYTKNRYIMPVKGEWFVFWGGINQFINYHYVIDEQRYAYDLIILKNGSSYSDSPQKNENFYAYNKEIVAPADGFVTKVIDGVEDNLPGEMNPDIPEGNCIIIEHTNNEYSMVAHLKNHSILVKEGERVKKGQVIGFCGNSGNSTETHLHFQVMDSPEYLKGKSIRIRFEDGIEPLQGDFITPF